MNAVREKIVRIGRVDGEKRLIFGEVYAPNILDTYCEFVTHDDLELMAHRFLGDLENLPETIDTNHDNIPNGCFPVESFIARDGDPDFTEGSWVLGVKVTDDHIWAQIKKGELNGFSFEALVRPVDVEVTLQQVRDLVGKSEEADGHDHMFFVQVNEQGRVVHGHTSMDADPDGDVHDHRIRRATVTEMGGDDRHVHRFFL